MAIEIIKIGREELKQYAQIPIRFRVESVLRVDEIDHGLGGLKLSKEPVDKPYEKDYDSYEKDEDGPPANWLKHFDVSQWLFLMGYDGETPVGGAVVAFRSSKVNMLEGRDDLAGLWDIRVHPGYRGRGIGTALFDQAAVWARKQGCKQLKAETQNINIRACEFYAARGCHLGNINRYGYSNEPRVAHEVSLYWYLNL